MKKKTQKTINLIRSSNNKSYFDDCADEIWNYDKIVGEMKNLKRRYSTIILSGGEPTLVNSLFLIIRGLKDAGLDVILYTNARMLSIERYCKELRRTGLHRISVQLFSHLPDFHDEITQVRGSFEQTIKGIENWKRLGGHVDIRTEPLEQNRDDMSGFVDFMIRLENIHDI